MSSEQKDVELEQWVSTYGFITTQRILSRYRIQLPDDMLNEAIKNQSSFYHHLIKMPLKQVLNGIILQQTHDYYVYAQKLYIDYLMSAELASPENSPGVSIRESLEEERLKLIATGSLFHQLELDQDALIASTQAKLIKLTTVWSTKFESVIMELKSQLKAAGWDDIKPSIIRRALHHAFIQFNLDSDSNMLFIHSMNEILQGKISAELENTINDALKPILQQSLLLKEHIDELMPKVVEVNLSARSFRTQMFDAIVASITLLKLLPTYRMDMTKDLANRESLLFDKSIGEVY